MRKLAAVCFCLLLAGSAWGRGMRGGGGGFRGGFGGGGFVRGGFGHGGFVRGGFGHGGFSRGGFGFRSPGRFGFNNFGFRHFSTFVPFGFGLGGYWGSYWPGYFDSNFGDYANYYAPPQPNVTVIYPDSTQPAPAVIVNVPPPARPVIHEYAQPEQPPPSSSGAYQSPLYLLAFKNHEIRAALAYWVEGDTLNYVDLDHVQKKAALDSLDRDFTAQLNRERRVPFRLPPAP